MKKNIYFFLMTYHLCLVCWFLHLFSQTKKSDQKKKHSGGWWWCGGVNHFFLSSTTIEIYTKRYKEIYICITHHFKNKQKQLYIY